MIGMLGAEPRRTPWGFVGEAGSVLVKVKVPDIVIRGKRGDWEGGERVDTGGMLIAVQRGTWGDR